MFPQGPDGFVRLGPRGRLFAVSIFHQLHCLQELARAMVETPASDEHVQHCLNYVRQTLLCAGSMRLEAMKKDESLGADVEKVDGIGFEHKCRDWTLLRRMVEENYERWTDEMRRE